MEEEKAEIENNRYESTEIEISKKSPIDSINAKDIINSVLNKKGFIIRFVLVFIILGIIVGLLTPKEYTAKSLILPQVSQDKGLGKKFGNFAALVGLKLGESNGTEILPTLYPVIVESTPFQREILQTPIQLEGYSKPVTLSYYLTSIKKVDALTKIKSYTIGLPGLLLSKLKSPPKESNITVKTDSTIYKISAEEQGQIGFINSNLFVQFNDVEGYTEISATMEEPVAAAQLAKNAQDLLQKFIINYNIHKAQDELDYIEDRYDEAKIDYIKKKTELGNFKDRNQNYIFSNTQNRLDQLSEDYELSFEIYSQLATQAESARLQVKKDTPIFTVLQPVNIPLTPSSTSLSTVVISFMLIGIIISICWVLAKKYYKEFILYLKN